MFGLLNLNPMEMVILLLLGGVCLGGVALLVALGVGLGKKKDAATGENLFPCPDCGRRVSRQATACPGCGRPFEAGRE